MFPNILYTTKTRSNLLIPKQLFEIPHLACLQYPKKFQHRSLGTIVYSRRNKFHECTFLSETTNRLYSSAAVVLCGL